MSAMPFLPGTNKAPSSDAAKEIAFSGTIERVVYQNPENGYAIFRVSPDGKDAGRGGVPTTTFSCVGTLVNPKQGQQLSFVGRFETNPKYGRQFRFSQANELEPTSEEALVSYLSSSLIKGMGPELAERVVKAFGKDTIRVLDQEPDCLKSVRGIGKKNFESIVESWREHRALTDLMQFLQPHGISPAYGVRIYREYGVQAIEIVRTNPYRLAMDIRGIGFVTADAIAHKLGFEPDDPLRMQGAVLYVLQKASEDGHVYLPLDKLVERIAAEFQLSEDAVLEAVNVLRDESRVVVETISPDENGNGEKAVYMSWLYRCEDKTAYYLERLVQMPSNVTFEKLDEQVEEALSSQPFTLDEEQAKAVRQAAANKVMVLTGGPGTGKTTIIKAIISLFRQVTARIYLAAPTGRAAKRMAEATGRDARTLHRMLEYNPGLNSFERNEDNPLACDLLIVDEASMMDINVFYSLLKAVPSGCVVIFVGDINQLPSVGPGAVLADIMASGRIFVAELSHIHRQDGHSMIVQHAHEVNEGQVPSFARTLDQDTDSYFLEAYPGEGSARAIVDLVCRTIPARFGIDAADVQLITPQHKGDVGTKNLNDLLQQTLNPGGRMASAGTPNPPRAMPEIRRGDVVFRTGDRVMQIQNNYEKDVFNGDVGFIERIDPETRHVFVAYDGRRVEYETSEMDELVLAYAISIHKSQGSEYPAVVIPLFTQHWIMLQRNLVYTAMTRGKKLVVFVGQWAAIKRSVSNATVKKRYTRLAEKLRSFVSNLPQ